MQTNIILPERMKTFMTFDFTTSPYGVPFKEYYMTPLGLDGFTANIISPCSTAPDQITFHESSVGDLNDELPLKVPLVAADELPDDTPLTVEIAVANDASMVKRLTVISFMACQMEPNSLELKLKQGIFLQLFSMLSY
ncbi:hypothetical protein AWC38_SpisGene9490 [Stylophora pistillata]|uniref:Uncharacterized protein n=1 Tax=Stylophora pistillata TaxID=50429 RepID=A0A2B4S7J1_STYPI|nr:hypothetical protein AWC38_SpisGene9490 [Stylophora pistillata]